MIVIAEAPLCDVNLPIIAGLCPERLASAMPATRDVDEVAL
jgi:hypothetical protein